MRWLLLLLSLLPLLPLLLPQVAVGQQSGHNDVAEPPSPIVVATDEWPPFRILDENKQFSGLDIDLLNELEKRTGYPFKIERYPWSRALSRMKTGQVDMMTGLAYTTTRAGFIDYIDHPYYICAPVFYVQEGAAKLITEYDDLYFFEIGYVLRSAYFEPFDSDKQLDKHGVPTEDQLLRMAKRGYLEVFIGTDCQVDYSIQQGYANVGLEKARFRPDHPVKLYLGFSKLSKHRDKKAKLSAALQQLLQEGWVQQAASHYLE